jgi:hypothetical protein
MAGTLPTPGGTANVTVVEGWNASVDPLAMIGTIIPVGVDPIHTPCDHADVGCLLRYAPLAQIKADGPCSSQDVFSRPTRGSAAGDISKIAATDAGEANYFGFLFWGGGGVSVPDVNSTISYKLP